ncbi:MAG: VWA domain-containing protein [Rhodoblastus sp.]|nr:VWA domain-containing protein [Rhodoblastus sp.]
MPRRIILAAQRATRAFVHNSSGAVAILFAIALFPMLLAAGGAVDYAATIRARQALDALADSAGLAAAEFAAQEYRKGNWGWNSAGVSAGQKAFAAGVVPNKSDISVAAPNIAVSLSGQVMTATVTYTAAVRTNLLRIARIDTMAVSNSMTTTVTVAKYTDLHIVIDNSQSMGMAASAADENIIQTSLGTTCFLGCHINAWPGADTAASYRAVGATLRIDVIKNAVVASLTNLMSSTAAGTVRVAIYTFDNSLTPVFPLSSNLAGAIAAANAVDLSTDHGGTNITYSLNALNALLPMPGSGMNAGSPKGAVLLFTDAVQDHEKFTLATGVWANDPNWVPYSPSVYNMWDYQPIDPGGCAPIKTKGYSMLVLNAQYIITSTDLAEQSRYGDIKNIVLPAVDSNIASCSSGAGYHYSANSPAQIMSAVTSMFASAANNIARLSR